MKSVIRIGRLEFYLWVGGGWLLLWIMNSFLNHSETLGPRALNEVWRTFFVVVVNFVFFEYSLPVILKRRSMIMFNVLIGSFLVMIHLVLLSFGLSGWKWFGVQLEIYTSFRQSTLTPDGFYYRMIDEVAYQAQGGVASFIFFGLAKLFYVNFKLRQTTQQLRLEKQEAELNYLKSQTNPHFLFNTLNNIYSLAKDKSDLAPESILRLSKILRFMLYETSGEFINVEQELEIISDYIALEKLRYDDSLRINFKHEIEGVKPSLPPLLLIPLVENAFKHGVSETRNQPFVDIHLKVNPIQLFFIVKNSTERIHGEKSVKENIGLNNLRRQLELLYADYHLTVQQDDCMFTATLEINLTSYV